MFREAEVLGVEKLNSNYLKYSVQTDSTLSVLQVYLFCTLYCCNNTHYNSVSSTPVDRNW